jgi:translocation and assembly module TamA
MFSDTLSGAAGIELGYQQTRDDAGREETSLLATLNTKLTWDARDDKLDPSSGFRGTLAASPAYNFTTRTPFATLGADFSIYRAFGRGDRFVLAGRAAAEMLTVGDIFAVPADKRLYSGGAGTVRGYGFKNIAPRDTNGDLIGGRSTLLLSGELRYRLTDTIGLVAFVDAGNAYPGLIPDPTDLRIGVGAGLRYLTPVGPIRLDVAMPLQPQQDDPSFAFYIGLGQAF